MEQRLWEASEAGPEAGPVEEESEAVERGDTAAGEARAEPRRAPPAVQPALAPAWPPSAPSMPEASTLQLLDSHDSTGGRSLPAPCRRRRCCWSCCAAGPAGLPSRLLGWLSASPSAPLLPPPGTLSSCPASATFWCCSAATAASNSLLAACSHSTSCRAAPAAQAPQPRRVFTLLSQSPSQAPWAPAHPYAPNAPGLGTPCAAHSATPPAASFRQP